MTEEHSEGPRKILTVDEIQKSLPLAAYSAYVQSRVLMYLASDYHCGDWTLVCSLSHVESPSYLLLASIT